VRLKWPNDLLVDNRKLGGLLCERVRKADLVGLGLNVNVDPADAPPDIRDRVTSLRAIVGRPLDMTDVLVAVAAELRRCSTGCRRSRSPPCCGSTTSTTRWSAGG
jgi:BirA family biotin operon repressor/biotin-[acetyl-CoA-carboxylase] ligase